MIILVWLKKRNKILEGQEVNKMEGGQLGKSDYGSAKLKNLSVAFFQEVHNILVLVAESRGVNTLANVFYLHRSQNRP